MESRQSKHRQLPDLMLPPLSGGFRALVIPVVVVSLLLFGLNNALASASITQLFGFPSTGNYPDGYYPTAPLLQASDGNLYGTAWSGGNDGSGCAIHTCVGTVFKLTLQGQFTLLHTFAYGNSSNPYPDGQNPAGGLVEGPDGYLYGVTRQGGTYRGYGTIYKISKTGQFQKLHDGCPRLPATCSDGGTPAGNLVVGADGALYGVMSSGGAAAGVIYKITTYGAYTKLADFTTATGGSPTNGLLLASDGNFYGGTRAALYRLTPGGQLTVIYAFGSVPQDGSGLNAPMIQAANGDLYGVTYSGGANHAGIVFRISLAGEYQKVFDINPPVTGVQPTGLVQASDGNLWGTTVDSGNYSLGGGAVYTITTAGTLVQSTFLVPSQTGAGAAAPLVQASDGKLYGTACCRGVSPASGTVFVLDAGLSPPPRRT